MKKIKIEVICFIILLLSFALIACSRLKEGDVKPVVNNMYYKNLIYEINNSIKTIDIVEFQFNNDRTILKIVDALKKADKRGVKIRILTEIDLKSKSEKILKLFKKTKVKYKYDTPKRKTHCKMFIFDKQKVLLGSTNLSYMSILYNNETNLIFSNKQMALYYTHFFNSLWKNSAEDPKLSKIVLSNAEPVVNRNYFPTVLKLLENSKRYIWVYMYGLKFNKNEKNHPITRFINAIIDAKKRKVDVRMIIEKSDYNDLLNKYNGEVAKYFKANDIEVRYDPIDKITHTKLVIVDDSVVLGSSNWGYGSMNFYNEANIMLKVKPITSFFKKYFLDLWKNNGKSVRKKYGKYKKY